MKGIAQKEKIVKEIHERLLGCEAILLVDYRGLRVRDMNELRRRCRDSGVEYRVVKNTLTSLAIKDTPFTPLDPYLTGPTALGISNDPVVLAKVFSEFFKEYKEFKIKALMIGNELFEGERVKEIAALPEREVLISQLLFYMKAPIYNLIAILLSPLRRLLCLLKAVESKELRR